RSAGWDAADAALGARRERSAAGTRARLRRPDGPLLRGGRAAVDVFAVAVSDPAAAWLCRAALRADVVAADPARRPCASARLDPPVAGRLGGPLGRRHARGRNQESERQDLAR